jgi:hypothetical protein
VTPEQTAKAHAYNAIDQVVLDDLTSYVYALPPDQGVGACRVLTYLLQQRTSLRRDKARGPRTVKRTND